MKISRFFLFLFPVLSTGLFGATVASSSSLWVSVPGNYDYLADQQTGLASSDIVGTVSESGFFTTFNAGNLPTNGTLGFRLRLDDAGGNTNNPRFTSVAWVGVDGDRDGRLDVFVGANFQGSTEELLIRTPGTGTNTSPSTTTISNTSSFSYAPTASNYNYRAVNYLSDGGSTNDSTPLTTGDPDYYMSFMIPFADLVSVLNSVGISADSATPLRYVVATSNQTNSLNQDLGGVNGGVNSSVTWEDLGGFTPYINGNGLTVVPEPTIPGLIGLSGVFVLLRRRRVRS
jgi:hypothetical protein